MDNIPELTTEFVSKIIGKKIKSFTIEPGTAAGENYMSVIYSLKCIEEGTDEIAYGFLKTYPTQPARQANLNKRNLFWNELSVYQKIIPAFEELRNQSGANFKLPFPKLLSGAAIDFGSGEENATRLNELNGRIFTPFENYIMMIDMKKTYGFRMANRLVGLSLDEISLVMSEHSKIHALSWAYKQKYGLARISSKYSFLDLTIMESDIQMWTNLMSNSCSMAIDAIKPLIEDSGIIQGILNFKNLYPKILKAMLIEATQSDEWLGKFLRVKIKNVQNEHGNVEYVPWRVLVHGDCWVNNFLFRYDLHTSKPVELVLIDLQAMHETCPTAELVNLFYTSTTAEFRKAHLDQMLELYAAKFMNWCDLLKVNYLPGFNSESLKERFHHSKILGLGSALMCLPFMLKDSSDVTNIEKLSEKTNVEEMFSSIIGETNGNVVYRDRILGVAQDMYNEGII